MAINIMVGVAVAMIISIQEKSYMDLHNARTFMFYNLVIYVSRNHADKIATLSLLYIS